MTICPCRMLDQDKIELEKCCGPIIAGKTKAPTAESLMRSRYSAYALKKIDFVDQTQIVLDSEKFDKEEALKWAQSSEWLGLEVKRTVKGQESDNTGTVEFIAHYKDISSGTDLHHHETSIFQKDEGNWKFREGQIHGNQPLKRLEPKVGRNDPCHCGSGKKYKKCCAA